MLLSPSFAWIFSFLFSFLQICKTWDWEIDFSAKFYVKVLNDCWIKMKLLGKNGDECKFDNLLRHLFRVFRAEADIRNDTCSYGTSRSFVRISRCIFSILRISSKFRSWFGCSFSSCNPKMFTPCKLFFAKRTVSERLLGK